MGCDKPAASPDLATARAARKSPGRTSIDARQASIPAARSRTTRSSRVLQKRLTSGGPSTAPGSHPVGRKPSSPVVPRKTRVRASGKKPLLIRQARPPAPQRYCRTRRTGASGTATSCRPPPARITRSNGPNRPPSRVPPAGKQFYRYVTQTRVCCPNCSAVIFSGCVMPLLVLRTQMRPIAPAKQRSFVRVATRQLCSM